LGNVKLQKASISLIVSVLAISISLISLWLNYRSSRQRKIANDPIFSFSSKRGVGSVTIQNNGQTPALSCKVCSARGILSRWDDQVSPHQRYDTSTGAVEGDEFWAPDCGGEARNILPGESVTLFLDSSETDTIQLIYSNYLGEDLRKELRLSEVPGAVADW
jgi:hypothetical protein